MGPVRLLAAAATAALLVAVGAGATVRAVEPRGGAQEVVIAAGRGAELTSPGGSDPFSWSTTAAEGPARWSSCEPVRVLVNPDGAPQGAVLDMLAAIRTVAAATGLQIDVLGQTDAVSTGGWGTERLPGHDGWPPVLVSWGPPGGMLRPAASAATEIRWAQDRGGPLVLVTAHLRVNTDRDHLYRPGAEGRRSRVAMYTHEWGHVVGLGHVDDDSQLMHAGMGEAGVLGTGDRRGLDEAGRGGCPDAPTPRWG